MAAAYNGHPRVVRALIAKGADIHAADAAGGTPTTYAAGNGHLDVFDLLVKAGGKWREGDVVLAAEGCHADIVQSMLKLGAAANAANNGRGALFMAVWSHCADAVTILIAGGANVNAKGPEGRTPLMQAAGDGQVELVQLLLEKGADMEAKDDAGRSAWGYAAMSGQLEVAEIFKKVRALKQQ
jgi:ankyrin repeat protein